MIIIFFDQFKKLCQQRSTTPSAVCKALGLSTAMPTNWKNGITPNSTNLRKFAEYFDVSVDYLLGVGESSSISETSSSQVHVSSAFVERILLLLSEKGISKNKMLADLSLGKNSFVNWESRGNTPSGETLCKIASYLDVSVDYLLRGFPDKAHMDTSLSPLQRDVLIRIQAFNERQVSQLLIYMDFLTYKEDLLN